jgi:hypothetical protein
MRRAAVLACLLTTGCNTGASRPPDRGGERFTGGALARLFDPESDEVAIVVKGASPTITVPVGTRVVVLNDSEPERDGNRPILITVMEGSHQGLNGFVWRTQVRPGL